MREAAGIDLLLTAVRSKHGKAINSKLAGEQKGAARLIDGGGEGGASCILRARFGRMSAH